MGKSKRLRLLNKILNGLAGEAKLNNNPGPRVQTLSPKSSKLRRHSGRKFGRIIKPQMKWKEVISQGLEPQEYWDNWGDYRDGQRDISSLFRAREAWYFNDGERYDKFISRNRKIKKHLAIRKAKKRAVFLRQQVMNLI